MDFEADVSCYDFSFDDCAAGKAGAGQRALTVLIALVSISFLEPVLSFLRRLERICGVSTVYTGLMIKCLLISLVSRLGVSFCKDAGRGGMASMLELSGILASAWTAIPLLEAFLSMLEEMI